MAFGEILKNRRNELGMTQEYIAERTHMMTKTIEFLETEDVRKIPAPIYGRGFIRQYCAVIGLDPEPLVEEYMAIVGGAVSHKPVTRPAVREIPAQPIAPIHTGGRKTMPPKEDEPKPAAHTGNHKLVTPAEDSFTAVPIPEDSRPPAEPTMQSADRVPEESGQPMSAEPSLSDAEQPAETIPRDIFAPAPKRRREVTSTEALSRMRQSNVDNAQGRPIFGPQHPVDDPQDPRLATLAAGSKAALSRIAALFAKASRPKVRRFSDDTPTPLLTQRQVFKTVMIFLTLVFLTVLVFGFRYVFRKSAAEQPPMDLGQSVPETFSPTPVAAPPEPFFR